MRRFIVAIAGLVFGAIIGLGLVAVAQGMGGPFDGIVPSGGGAGGSALIMQEEATPLANTPHTTLNFVGAGVTAADAGGGVTSVTVPDTTFDGGAVSTAVTLPALGATSPAIYTTGDPDTGLAYKTNNQWVMMAGNVQSMYWTPTTVYSNVALYAQTYIYNSNGYVRIGGNTTAQHSMTFGDVVFTDAIEVSGLIMAHGGAMYMLETAAAPADIASHGILWVGTDNLPKFTEDDGTDHVMAYDQECHAEMWQNDNAVVTTINTVDIWEEVNNFSSGLLESWTHSAGALTVGSNAGGNYGCSAAISSASAGTNQVFEFSFSVNDVIQEKCDDERKYSTVDTGAQPVRCDLALVAADVVKLEVRNVTSAANITIVDANAGCHRL